MRILGRYIFREIISSSLLGTGLATAIIFLQGVGKLFEVLVRSSPRPETILYLFALSLPPLLPLTIPFGALVGILVGLGRMATDGEITAMRAAGVLQPQGRSAGDAVRVPGDAGCRNHDSAADAALGAAQQGYHRQALGFPG